MHRRLTATVALTACLVLTAQVAAFADGTGDAFTDGTQVGTNAGDSGNQPGKGGGGGGKGSSPVKCTYERLADDEAKVADNLALRISAGSDGGE